MKKVIAFAIALALAILLFSCQKEICNQPELRHDGTIVGHTRNGKDNGALDFFPDPAFGNPPYQYSIDGGQTWKDGLGTGITINYTFTNLKAGKYYMVIKGKDGCMSNTYEVVIEAR